MFGGTKSQLPEQSIRAGLYECELIRHSGSVRDCSEQGQNIWLEAILYLFNLLTSFWVFG
ncbi:MAG: hypothetical protein JWP81_296 [Ferruginibacter sp.]|nr:hypothetical protein [Ferruginibacter sp.]